MFAVQNNEFCVATINFSPAFKTLKLELGAIKTSLIINPSTDVVSFNVTLALTTESVKLARLKPTNVVFVPGSAVYNSTG